MNYQDIWEQKTNKELEKALSEITTYRPEVREIIRNEIERRKNNKPPITPNKISLEKETSYFNNYQGNTQKSIQLTIRKKILIICLIGGTITSLLLFIMPNSMKRIKIEGKLEKFTNNVYTTSFFIKKNGKTYYVIPPRNPNLEDRCIYTLEPNDFYREYTIIKTDCK